MAERKTETENDPRGENHNTTACGTTSLRVPKSAKTTYTTDSLSLHENGSSKKLSNESEVSSKLISSSFHHSMKDMEEQDHKCIQSLFSPVTGYTPLDDDQSSTMFSLSSWVDEEESIVRYPEPFCQEIHRMHDIMEGHDGNWIKSLFCPATEENDLILMKKPPSDYPSISFGLDNAEPEVGGSELLSREVPEMPITAVTHDAKNAVLDTKESKCQTDFDPPCRKREPTSCEVLPPPKRLYTGTTSIKKGSTSKTPPPSTIVPGSVAANAAGGMFVPCAERSYILETEPRENDVLCGRGGGSNLHPGNKAYWKEVLELEPEYKAVGSQDRAGKERIGRLVLSKVRRRGGRFLQRDKITCKQSIMKNQLYEVPDEIALRKIKQALRDRTKTNCKYKTGKQYSR